MRIRSSEGGEFDCHFEIPRATQPVPAIVLATAVFGVDDSIRTIAAQLASHGYIVAAPDLFWRTLPGPLALDDPRAPQRSQPRLEKIQRGEQDLKDVLAALHREPAFNGRAAVMGLCYGGPYAILGPKRLGFQAGISCHGTQMLDFIGELEGVTQPVCLLWGDQDHLAPAHVLDAFRVLAGRMKNLEVDVFPGVKHSYMMHGHGARFDQGAYDFSLARAVSILEGLR